MIELIFVILLLSVITLLSLIGLESINEYKLDLEEQKEELITLKKVFIN